MPIRVKRKPTTPPAQTGLSATPGAGVIDLAWVASTPVGGYIRVLRSEASGSGYAQVNTNGATTGTTYSDTPPSNDVRYYYVIVAVKPLGTASGYSSEANAMLPTGSAWSDSGSIAGVTIGTLTLDATFESIMIELPITEDTPGTITSATVEFRTTAGPGTTRAALPLSIIRPTGLQAACYGKVLLLTHNTPYDVRVTLNGTALKASTITTRNDNLTPANEIVYSHYLDPVNGSDSNNGTSTLTPWRTLNKFNTSAPTGSNARLAPGWTARATAVTTKSLGVFAQFPSVGYVDNVRTIINEGNHSIIFDRQTGPTGATDPHLTAVAPWTLVNPTFDIYKWVTGTPATSSARHMDVVEVLADDPLRIAPWKRSGDAATYALWEAMLTTNLNYNYGFWADSNGDIYLRLPPTAPSNNPNDLYVTLGGSSTTTDRYGLYYNAANCRMSGVAFRCMNAGVQFGPAASFGHCDHFLTDTIPGGVRIFGTANGGVGSVYGSDHVIEDWIVRDSGMWTYPNPTKDNTGPWTLVKGQVVKADGVSLHSPNRFAEGVEGHAIDSPGGSRRTVIRRGTVIGTFNGVGGNSTGFDRYANYGLDVHDLHISQVPDEAIEYETNQIGGAFWNIRAEHCKEFVSTSPLNYGPQYYFRSSGWQLGSHGLQAWPANSENVPGSGGVHKYSPPTTATRARVYFLHLTFWSNITTPMSLAPQGRHSGGGSSPMLNVYERNCIWRTPGRIIDWAADLAQINTDYCLYASGDALGVNEGWKYSGVIYDTLAETATWRAAILAQTGSNPANVNLLNATDIAFGDEATIDALFTDPTNGDLTLKAGTNHAVGAGVLIANINDIDGALDLGFAERA